MLGGFARRLEFQSTLPLRGVTITWRDARFIVMISIHTPLAGSDPCRTVPFSRPLTFQSTLPLQGVTATCDACEPFR